MFPILQAYTQIDEMQSRLHRRNDLFGLTKGAVWQELTPLQTLFVRTYSLHVANKTD